MRRRLLPEPGGACQEFSDACCGRQCQYCDCNETITSQFILCLRHYREFKDGRLNRCNCGLFKYVRYPRCSECHNGTAVARDDRDFGPDREGRRFFVYVLLLTGGDYYVGLT